MCICVHCNYPVYYLCTSYKSASNIRLAVCPQCNLFADPLIEHPPTLLLIDLILLKPRVYRHLLFNRGSSPNRPGEDASVQDGLATTLGAIQRWSGLVLAAETVVKLQRHDTILTAYSAELVWLIYKSFWTTLLETAAQHATTILLASVCLRWLEWLPSGRRKEHGTEVDGRRLDLIIPLISLALLYASLLPLLLHLIITVWTPMASLSSAPVDLARLKSSGSLNLLSVPTSWYAALPQAWAAAVKDVLVDLRHEGLDEMWVAVHLLGGMSSGFALRVLLPARPWQTSLIVLGGWLAKTAAAWWTH